MKKLDDLIEEEIDKLSVTEKTPKDIHDFARLIAEKTIKAVMPQSIPFCKNDTEEGFNDCVAVIRIKAKEFLEKE